MQDNLKWDNHVNMVTNKLNKFNSILYLVRKDLNTKSLLSIYNSLIYSWLTYTNVVWSHTTQFNINKLIRSQKKIIRTMMFRNRYHHTNADFLYLNILKINEVNNYFSGIFTYKSLNNICHPMNYFNYVQHHIFIIIIKKL